MTKEIKVFEIEKIIASETNRAEWYSTLFDTDRYILGFPLESSRQ